LYIEKKVKEDERDMEEKNWVKVLIEESLNRPPRGREYQLEQLIPQTSYLVRMRARNELGWSLWSVTQNFVTLEGMSACLSVCMSICMSVYLYVSMCVCRVFLCVLLLITYCYCRGV